MSVPGSPQHRRRGRAPRGTPGPEAVTEAPLSAERDDSRATITALADAVAVLTRQVEHLQALVMNTQTSREATAETVKPPPEDEHRTSETDDAAAQSNRDHIIQDVSWFEDRNVSPPKQATAPFPLNPWMQQITTASQMEIFDGDTRKWPTFIANFRALVHETVCSDAQRIAILGQLLSPKLRNGLSGLLANPEMYRDVLRQLHRMYGDPKALAKMNLNDLMSLAPLRSEQTSELEMFFCKVSGPVSTMKLCGLIHDLKSSALLELTASKLTQRLHERWLSYQRGLSAPPTLETFVEWLQTILSEKLLTSCTSGTAAVMPVSRERKRPTVRAMTVPEADTIECFVCRKGKHLANSCPSFLNMNLHSRAEEVLRHGLCLRCLRHGHRQRDCTLSRRCGKEGCQAYHHRLMHGAPRLLDLRVKAASGAESPTRRGEIERIDVGLASSRRQSEVVCAVVPVVAHGNGRSVRTFALLDSGSEISLLSKRLAQQMNLASSPQSLRLRTVTGETSLEARRTNCEVSSLNRKARFDLKQALVVPNLRLGTRTVPLSVMKGQWAHLRSIRFPVATLDQVEMLIGMDVPLAHQFREVRVGPNAQACPIGVRTPFGWTIVGHVPKPEQDSSRREEDRWVRRHVMNGSGSFENLLRRFVDADPLNSPTAPGRVTIDERTALNILETTTRFDGHHYEVGLLWKSPGSELSCNRASALKRFFANERRLIKDAEVALKYNETMQQYIRDGHAKKVAPGDRGTPGRVWYLPHHAVWNTNRTKIRVVFDASAKHQGVSLNDCLLKGPDYLPNLCGVLLRFRLRQIPISSDIERMYHQVKVKGEDRSALRFLWRPPGSTYPPKTYEMHVHVFGAKSSPCVCMYALRRAAADHKTVYPEALRRMSNVYVDNWLESFDTIEQARTACKEMNDLLGKTGFHLRKWATTVPEVLGGISSHDLSEAMVNMPLSETTAETILGLIWDCSRDVIHFSFKGPLPLEPTKREMLSCVARLFDPLGLLSPVVIPARVLIQDLWKTKCDWDDVPEEHLVKKWQIWVRNLQRIDEVKFTRCLRPKLGDVTIHIFCDASESAYGAVAYLRTMDDTGEVTTCLALAKVRVAPIRRQSIPRLELLGAVIAVRIARVLSQELQVPNDKFQFWTDSQVVLCWLTSVRKKFPVFIENRTTEILDGFEPSQWRHVPGADNPADDLSKGLSAAVIHPKHRWITGPRFLVRSEAEWPPTPVFVDNAAESEELRAVRLTVMKEVVDPIITTINRMSDLDRLVRTLAYVRRFIHLCRRRTSPGTLDLSECQRAWHDCIRAVQRHNFSDEISLLRNRKSLPRTSRFRALAPFVDHEGLIRVGGRLDEATVHYDTKHPLILPSPNALTTLLIRQTHLRNCHAGIETTLNVVRAKVWIINGRAAVKRVLRQCTVCRRYRLNPSVPRTAPLPVCRVQRPSAPFTHVGIDFAGPIAVSCRRSQVKRWICLFTCMATRGAHIEVCHSLDTTSFLSAFRRFMARRGTPAHCYSDNGTNFVAAARALGADGPNTGNENLKNFMLSRGITWHFNPPCAPHFGGAWERLIRSAKFALRTTLHAQHVTDEALLTVLAEVEWIMNCRPLTYTGTDPSDLEPLTPNHFLLGRAYSHMPLDVLPATEGLSLRKWRATQVLLDQFWKRWMREYVPTLTPTPNSQAKQPTIARDTIVLLVDSNVPRGQWLMGKVLRLFPGKDGIPRVAEVKTKLGVRRRPLVKLLEILSVSRQETGVGHVGD